MIYYILDDNKIKLFANSQEKITQMLSLLPQYEGYEILTTEKNIVEINGQYYFEDDEEYNQEKRHELDALTLTPADVERALYKAKGMDFEDLKALIAQQLPQVDIKGLAIEFRARDFYRGAMANGIRLFDVVGQLLGYSSSDMDYLFENKELPQ